MTESAPSRRRIPRDQLWFRIHSFVGMKLSLLLAFVFLTGTLATVSDEIDWLISPAMRAPPPAHAGLGSRGDEPDWAAIADTLAARAPHGAIDTIEAPRSPIFAAAAYLTRPDGGVRVIYFDPATGAATGEGSLLTAKTLLRRIHRHWLLSEEIGIPIVTALAFLMLASLITAMLVYRRWWRGLLRWPRRGYGARVFWSDVHRLAGSWGLGFGLLIAATGIWYFTEQLIAPAPGFARPMTVMAKIDNARAAERFPDSLAAARRAYPELAIRRIDWPGLGGAAFGFYGQDGTLLVRPRASGVVIDAENGKTILRYRGAEASAHQRLSEAADPLHFGDFAGYWSKLAWFVFGAALTALAASGAVVCGKRLARGTAGTVGKRRPALRGLAIATGLAGAMAATVAWQLPGEVALLR